MRTTLATFSPSLHLSRSSSTPLSTIRNASLQVQVKQLLYTQVILQYLRIDQVFPAAHWELQLINDCSLHRVPSLVAEYAFERMLSEPENLVADVRGLCSVLAQSSEFVNLDALSEFSDVVEGLCVGKGRGIEGRREGT